MIRPATQEDLRRLMEMAEAFYPQTTYWTLSKIPFDVESVAMLTLTMIDTGIVNVLELDGLVVGVIGLVIAPFLFNPKYATAGEIIFWIEPEFRNARHGRELLLSIEEQCKEKSVAKIQMADLANSSDSVAMLYESVGYQLTERFYSKVV